MKRLLTPWARTAMTLLALFLFLTGARAQLTLPYSYGFEDNDLSTDGWTTQNPSGLNDSEFGINEVAAKTDTYGFRFLLTMITEKALSTSSPQS